MTNNETILRQNCADLQEQLASANRRIAELMAAATDQKPVAFWWIGPDGKDNGGPYRGTASEFAINNARNMGCEPQLLYAAPTPATAPDGGMAYLLKLSDDPCQCHCCRSKQKKARALLQSFQEPKS